jgi:hypothetical protein
MNDVKGYAFPYEPIPAGLPDDDGDGADLVVATERHVDATAIGRALGTKWGEVRAETLLARTPLFWTRVRVATGCVRSEVHGALSLGGVPVRYVASARRQSMTLPPPVDTTTADVLAPSSWGEASDRGRPHDPESPGRWFLREGPGGLAIDRARCGTGRGTRLAVVDDDAADFEQLDLDSTELVGTERRSSASGHGAKMIGWAVGARTYKGSRFWGVAPDASVRAYLIPRPSEDLVPMPLAIARAAIDGADVIVCATYAAGMTTPMLEDALEVASRLGRRGRGCLVVFPTSRETSSPKGSIHASLSLSLGDVASDPRVVCIGPGARQGGWFLWREQRGRLRPLANRGPAVCLLAPGDDLSHPFFAEERLAHAESSAASALAAGVLLLALANNGHLRSEELFAVVQRCAMDATPFCSETLDALVDKADAQPFGRDADGHDAKHGYGRLHALRTCLAASDPVALELVSMGEDAAARAWLDYRQGGLPATAYSPDFARSAVRALLSHPASEHALRVVLRHLRLVSGDPRRIAAHPSGALARQLSLTLRSLARSAADVPENWREELGRLEELTRAASETPRDFETALFAIAERVFRRAERRDAETLPVPGAAAHPSS